MPLPAVLHLDVLPALLLQHHKRINAAGRIESLGLQHFQIGGDALPCIIEYLIGLVFIHQGEVAHALENITRDRLLLA